MDIAEFLAPDLLNFQLPFPSAGNSARVSAGRRSATMSEQTLWVTDAELIRRLGVPEKTAPRSECSIAGQAASRKSKNYGETGAIGPPSSATSIITMGSARSEVPRESAMELPQVTTPKALAKHLGVSERRIRAIARRLGACRIFGNLMALTKEDVDAILEDAKPRPLGPSIRARDVFRGGPKIPAVTATDMLALLARDGGYDERVRMRAKKPPRRRVRIPRIKPQAKTDGT